jgi:CubicO group peptidase (beta-lactamase class C family)
MTYHPNENLEDPVSVNIDPRKLEKAVDRFIRQNETGIFPGGQLVLRRDGKLVTSVSVGVARGFRPDEDVPALKVASHTAFPVLSVGKPLAATVIALLEDRSLLSMDDPVCRYIPGFTGHGKEKITILDVLTHRSGMLLPGLVKNKHAWRSRSEIQAALIECVPSHPRGTLAYHPHEYGWILDEIVRAAVGRTLPTFFNEEIAMPLQLPDLGFGLSGRAIDRIAYGYWLGPEKVNVAGSNVARDFEWQNSEEFFDANNPAVSLVANAESIAAFYDFLLRGGKTPRGEQLISTDLIERYTTQCVFGWDRSLRTFVAIGRGFVVGSLIPSNYGWWNTSKCFGHGGGFSCLAFGDYERNISVAIFTNGNRSLLDFAKRFIPLAQSLRYACRV